MIIVGKKSPEEIQKLRAKLVKEDRKDHDIFVTFEILWILLIALICGFCGSIIVIESLNGFGYTTTSNTNSLIMLLLIVTVFVILCVCCLSPYEFDDDSMSLPKTYRYFYLTNDKKVLREEVYINQLGSGACADLGVVIEDDDGEETCLFAGTFPIELKRDIQETIVDLEAEKIFVPCNANDVKFADDYKNIEEENEEK